MNRNWVLFNLREAEEQLRRMIAQIESTPDFGFGEFSVAMGHAYHHLNTAWNSQNALPASVEQCSQQEFYRWRQFPTDIYLGP